MCVTPVAILLRLVSFDPLGREIKLNSIVWQYSLAMENYDLLPRVGRPLRQTPNSPYPEASSKTETELKSDVIPLQSQNPKRFDVFELLL